MDAIIDFLLKQKREASVYEVSTNEAVSAKTKKDIPTEPKHPYDNTTGPLIKKANGTNRRFYGK